MLRSPICAVIGHVDHGKTSILDQIRESSIAASEAGGITQAISSTNISLKVIKKICGNLLKDDKIKVPGILFIDTPGHAAFSNMRKRGGNLADIAILVVDIREGVKEQTLECIEILKKYKTPFVIAANKIDMISGWRSEDIPIIENINKQSEDVKKQLDTKLYELVGKLSELGFNSERFDRVEDYTKQIAIVPVSAKTREGIPGLLMMLIGLAQKFLESKLEVEKVGKGVVLEVKEEKGLGGVLDVILYDGSLKLGDVIVIGGLEKPIVTKVRVLIEEKNVDEVHAAAGVRIVASDIENVVGGMPLVVGNENLEKAKEEVQKEVGEVLIETDEDGVVVKADTLGSLEALVGLLKEKDVKIKRAAIGNLTKKDFAEAASSKDPLLKAILGFNVGFEKKADIKVVVHDVIYKIIDDYEEWKEKQSKSLEAKELERVVRPYKIQSMKGYVFRQSGPAVFGVNVLSGVLKNNTPLMRLDGVNVGKVKSIQLDKENVSEAKKNEEVAISVPGVTMGRQISENDILLSDIPEADFVKLKGLKKYLNGDEIEILKKVAEIKRKENPVWGI